MVTAKRIKELRTLKKLTQKKLASMINYSQSLVSRWEKGIRIPSALAVIKLIRIFDCTCDYLLGMDCE